MIVVFLDYLTTLFELASLQSTELDGKIIVYVECVSFCKEAV